MNPNHSVDSFICMPFECGVFLSLWIRDYQKSVVVAFVCFFFSFVELLWENVCLFSQPNDPKIRNFMAPIRFTGTLIEHFNARTCFKWCSQFVIELFLIDQIIIECFYLQNEAKQLFSCCSFFVFMQQKKQRNSH